MLTLQKAIVGRLRAARITSIGRRRATLRLL
jgi:hypothetical protein